MDFCDEFYFGHAFVVFAFGCGGHVGAFWEGIGMRFRETVCGGRVGLELGSFLFDRQRLGALVVDPLRPASLLVCCLVSDGE